MANDDDTTEGDAESVDNHRGTMFEPVADSYDALEDADDERLIRLVYAYDRDSSLEDETGIDEFMQDLPSHALATFTLKERGYEFDGDLGELIVRDSDGSVVAPDFVEIDQ